MLPGGRMSALFGPRIYPPYWNSQGRGKPPASCRWGAPTSPPGSEGTAGTPHDPLPACPAQPVQSPPPLAPSPS
eukprot:CAMPEP_0202911362 /NCGR_PEP_ID=MMETSP1392-20130828/54793_1 /ASSEMBLY_ACC=CAM_ASM_000868 /TAXON_ID=225041 /ORGANISM="Chlamydomonas chlamydogama, Strain SAG 11-48b" /LENGTH=73 /DNA_ID=CAMNT_0049601843 /DNA_START=393 /DNA_END=611 /DNA_ORIENTATION=+